MNQVDRGIFSRLGDGGLLRVLSDLLDQGRLVHLANACGLRYPGMRTQSQKRERILADLVDRAGREEAARRAILRVLSKETAAARRSWGGADAAERARRLSDESALAAAGGVGLHLFLAASSTDPESVQALSDLLARDGVTAAPPASAASPGAGGASSREADRIKKKNAELQKKVQYLDGQVIKARETERTLKRELMQRKGELAESRMLVERLRRELLGAQTGTAEPPPTPPSARAAGAPHADALLEEVAKTTRKLAQDQRKVAHAVEKLASTPPPALHIPPETLAPVLEAVEDLRRESAASRRERKKDDQERDKALEEIRTGLRALRSSAAVSPAAARASRRRKDEPERVGVFIDVQNVYYGARQLKGKLDFDALLQNVVRGRRLILAKAYVVESKEIDQSGFIAILQQRAIEVRRKTLKVRSDGSMKGDWDMEMALDILDAAPSLDVVGLVSGDGDFTSLVNRVKAMGPRVEVVAFPRNTAKSLLEAADEFQALDRKFMIRTPDVAGARDPSEEPPPTERARPLAAVGGGEGPPPEESRG
jgi:uncharacterized LabA/DUF88 family protein